MKARASGLRITQSFSAGSGPKTVLGPRHTLTHRPIVLSAAEELKVSVEGGRSGPQIMSLSIDGQETFGLEPGDAVMVKRHPRSFQMLAPEGFSYFDILRRKLSWGER